MRDESQAVAVRQSELATSSHGTQFTQDQIDLIKRTVAKECNDTEFAVFMYQCQRRGLDPMVRQIHAVKRAGQMTIQTGIDGFRLIAKRTGKYAGRVGPFWCGEDGEWRDVWLKKTPPAAAKVGVRSKDFDEVTWGVALWQEFAQYTKEGELSRMWSTMGALMLAKCAEAQALRADFPEELSGIYTDDEMMQADNGGRPHEEVAPRVSTTPTPQIATRGQQAATTLTDEERARGQKRYDTLKDKVRAKGGLAVERDPSWSNAFLVEGVRALVAQLASLEDTQQAAG